jgi:hypothetical protein
MNRPRPVLTSNGIAGGVLGIAAVLTFLGYANAATSLSGEAQGIGGAVVFLLPLLSHLTAGHIAQQKVTPLESPVSADGTPLVPATTVAQVNATAVQPGAAPVVDGVSTLDPATLAGAALPAQEPPPAGAHAADLTPPA